MLWDLGLLIEFPAGSTILIPSAILKHSNVPIGNSEARASFTQYAAGGLFRFVLNGCRSDKALRQEDPILAERIRREGTSRWMEGLRMYSTPTELAASGLE